MCWRLAGDAKKLQSECETRHMHGPWPLHCHICCDASWLSEAERVSPARVHPGVSAQSGKAVVQTDLDTTHVFSLLHKGIWRHSRRRRCQVPGPQHKGIVRKWEHHCGARIKANASARDERATFFGIAPLHGSGILGFGFFHSIPRRVLRLRFAEGGSRRKGEG